MLAAVTIMIAPGSGVVGCSFVKRPVERYDRRGHHEVVLCVAEFFFCTWESFGVFIVFE